MSGEQNPDGFDGLLREAAETPAVASRRELLSGASVASGRYVVRRKIGEGGMGVVYEAREARTRARVALKTLSRVDASGIYRLKREFRALADVAHDNLVGLHELFADGAD